MGYSDIIRVLSCGFILSAAALAAGQVQSGSPLKANAGGLNASAKEEIDLCKLLSSAEVEAVQGESVKEAKAGAQPSGAMLMSQCVFHTSTSAKSVNVALATPRRAGDSGLAPREFWQRQFHSTEVKEKETRVAGKEAAPERDEEGSRARPIDGPGEEGNWGGHTGAGRS